MNGESLDRRWWAVYTKARQEKAFARDLLRHEIPFYLPVVKKTLVYRGRRVRSRVPLFGGYVFLFGTDDERGTSLATSRVSRMLPVGDPEKLRSDLRELQRLIDAGIPLTIEGRLAPGRRVRVRRGPFEGIEGTVVKRRSGMRLVVHVDFLQQGASVEIEDYMVEPIV
jgi:transcription antitermination factor NusG